MAQEKDNEDDEYYVPIKNILIQRIVKTNRFGQAAAIALDILTCQSNAFLQTSRPGSIENIKNDLENVSIFKPTMDHMDMINCNYDDRSMNFTDPIILA